jgi:hypothetical protein
MPRLEKNRSKRRRGEKVIAVRRRILKNTVVVVLVGNPNDCCKHAKIGHTIYR